jgi:hypothetical protein
MARFRFCFQDKQLGTRLLCDAQRRPLARNPQYTQKLKTAPELRRGFREPACLLSGQNDTLTHYRLSSVRHTSSRQYVPMAAVANCFDLPIAGETVPSSVSGKSSGLSSDLTASSFPASIGPLIHGDPPAMAQGKNVDATQTIAPFFYHFVGA